MAKKTAGHSSGLVTRYDDLLKRLPTCLRDRVMQDVMLAPLTTLRVGGPADIFLPVGTAEELAEAVCAIRATGVPWFVLGGGSNVCVSDRGFRGAILLNRCSNLSLGELTTAGTGVGLMQLFLKAACAGLGGLEFAVGIPGTLGGALVSNAGAYRRSIAPLVESLEVVENGAVRSVSPAWMEFGYRDSRLRRCPETDACILSVTLRLTSRPPQEIFQEAREYQRNRIHRQPWQASAGSFFKNVYDEELAQRLPGLPQELREAGVVPAGYLSAACGCKGLGCGGAQVSPRHGNFIVNRGGATAQDIRTLAETVKERVRNAYGVVLEEEVLYVGEW